jgi:hypothetical protein
MYSSYQKFQAIIVMINYARKARVLGQPCEHLHLES